MLIKHTRITKYQIISMKTHLKAYNLCTLFILRPTSVRIWHKAFLKWVLSQGRSSHASDSSKNASGPVGILLFGAPLAQSDKPNPSEEG